MAFYLTGVTVVLVKKIVGMIYNIIDPPVELSKIVRHYWFIEKDAGNVDGMPFKLMADGFANLIFQYNSAFRNMDDQSNSFPSVILHGHSSQVYHVTASDKFGVCGIALFPYAIPRLFNVPASEVVNTVADGSLFLPGCVGLVEKITRSKNDKERAGLFTKFILENVECAKPGSDMVEIAVRQIVKNHGIISIEKLAKKLDVSRRQFERKFLDSIGLTPKFYSRIIRFESTLLYPSTSITDIALSHGYADQAHFIREFREFSGMSPKKYFKGEREAAENFVEII